MLTRSTPVVDLEHQNVQYEGENLSGASHISEAIDEQNDAPSIPGAVDVTETEISSRHIKTRQYFITLVHTILPKAVQSTKMAQTVINNDRGENATDEVLHGTIS